MTQDSYSEAAIQASADAQKAERLRMVHMYVADGPDYIWVANSEDGRKDTLHMSWDPESHIQVVEGVSRLVSDTFNGKGFEFLNSADKAYDAKSRAFYFMIMLKQSGQPVAADTRMERVKVSWLNSKIDDVTNGDEAIVSQSFKHFKLLHKRV